MGASRPAGKTAASRSGGPAQTKPTHVLKGHTAPVVGLAVSPDGRTWLRQSWDSTVRLWSLKDGASRVLEGHQQNVNGVAFTPDGRAVVSAGYDLTLRIWPLGASGSADCRHVAHVR